MTRVLATFVVVVLGGYALLCLAMIARQRRFLYFPGPPPSATPADEGLDYREVELLTADGVRLHAWFLPAAGARGAVVFSHGNAGSIAHRLAGARAFLEHGLSVLLYDYRGYGKSEGTPGEEGTYLDAEAAYDWLAGPGAVPAGRIVLYGESLGGAVAIELARRRPVAAVFVESTFTSVPDIAARIYPWLPVRLLATIRYANVEKVADLRVPLLVAHSPEDDIVPFDLGRKLFEAAREPKRMLETAGGHNDGGFLQRPEWRRAVGEFLLASLQP